MTIADAKNCQFSNGLSTFFRMLQTTLMTKIIENLCFRTLYMNMSLRMRRQTSPIFSKLLNNLLLHLCIFVPIELYYKWENTQLKFHFLPCCCIPRRNFRELIWTFCPALYSSSCCTQSMVLRICRFPSFSPEEGLRNQRPEPQTFFWVAPLYRWPLKQGRSTTKYFVPKFLTLYLESRFP